MEMWVLLGLAGLALGNTGSGSTNDEKGAKDVSVAKLERTTIVIPESQENTDKIVGGNVTTIREYPYQVSLERRKSHACGASIINEKWVLTAAHCLYGQDTVNLMRIRAGTSFREEGGQVRSVLRWFISSKYSYFKADYDAALLELHKPLVFNEDVQPVTLTLPHAEPQPGDEVTVSGWGQMHNNAPGMPHQLMTVTVPVVDRAKCEKAYASSQEITKRMICAGIMGKDSCQGDSGGPLIIHRNNTKVQVGIVSWGRGCALEGFPGVYTNLAYMHIQKFICYHTKVCSPGVNVSSFSSIGSVGTTKLHGVVTPHPLGDDDGEDEDFDKDLVVEDAFPSDDKEDNGGSTSHPT